jgi:hypothetical protein
MNTSTAPTSTIDDLKEYVDAFRMSSNRSRYALYVVVVTSVLLGIATRNAHPGGWSLRRLEAWYGMPLAEQPFFGRDTMVIKVAREEYLRQFVARGVMPASPIPGVSMDINDLGLIGGIALVLLTLVLLFCLLREHEHLQLAMYKVRQMCSDDPDGYTRGDSRANMLYHALAMGEVLSSPPTLARWRRRGVLRHFGFIFYIPAAVQAWVLWNNWETRHLGARYGVDLTLSLVLQLGLFLFIAVVSSCALIATRAMTRRWTSAFYHINPSRRVAPQPTLLQWMKLTRRPRVQSLADEFRPRITTALVDTLVIGDASQEARVPVRHEITIARERIHKRDMQSMLATLCEKGDSAARAWCEHHQRGRFDGLVSFQPDRNQYLPRKKGDSARADWVVSGTWTFRYVPAINGKAAAPPALEKIAIPGTAREPAGAQPSGG